MREIHQARDLVLYEGYRQSRGEYDMDFGSEVGSDVFADLDTKRMTQKIDVAVVSYPEDRKVIIWQRRLDSLSAPNFRIIEGTSSDSESFGE